MALGATLALTACRQQPKPAELAPAPAREQVAATPAPQVTNSALLSAPALPVAATVGELLDATLAHDLDRARQLLEANPALINATNAGGDTALYIATFRGFKLMTEFLLASGANPNPAPNRRGETPLSIALELNHRQSAGSLRNAGAEENAITRGAALRSAIARRQPEEAARLLATQPGLIASRNALGNTALHLTAMNGDLNSASLLLSFKADPNATNAGGGTPYSAAIERGDTNMIALLRSHGGQANAISEGAPIRDAARKGLLFVAESLLAASPRMAVAADDLQRTPLHETALAGHAAMVGLLLKHKADPVAKDFSGTTPLHNAAQSGTLESVRLLVSAGADVNVRNRQLATPLHLAAAYGHREVAVFLLEKGAELEAQDNSGQRALQFAVIGGHEPMVAFLLDRGSPVNAQDRRGGTPLHVAATKNRAEIVRLLLGRGADPAIKDNIGRTALAAVEALKMEEMAKLLREAAPKQ
jgi:ankyrin repeat protein